MMIMQGIVKKSSELKQSSLVKIDYLEVFTFIANCCSSCALALSLHIKTLPSLCILIHYSMYVLFTRILDVEIVKIHDENYYEDNHKC
jgi:hypothetical protein